MRSALLFFVILAGCTVDNPDYCAPGPAFADCVRLRLGIEGPPDLVGYQIVPLPDMVDAFQCIAPGEHCSDDGELKPGVCCGNYLCFATACKPSLHGACERDVDCAPVVVGSNRSPAICFSGSCMSQTGGVCTDNTDCASGSCNHETARCR